MPSPTWIYLVLTSNSRFLFTHSAYSFICKNRDLDTFLLFTAAGYTKEKSALLEGHCKRAIYYENYYTLEQMSRGDNVVHPPMLEGCNIHPDTGIPILGILFHLSLLWAWGWTRDYCLICSSLCEVLIQWHLHIRPWFSGFLLCTLIIIIITIHCGRTRDSYT